MGTFYLQILSESVAESVTAIAQPRTDVVAIDCSSGSLEAQPDVLEPSSAALTDGFALARLLRVEEDVRLFLECALALHCQFCCHDCD